MLPLLLYIRRWYANIICICASLSIEVTSAATVSEPESTRSNLLVMEFLASFSQWHLIMALLFTFSTLEHVHAEGSVSLVKIYEPFLSSVPTKGSDFNPYMGGRNTGKCCQMAVNESLYIIDGELRLRPNQTFYRGSLSTLELYPTFPCTTVYNGSLIAPPQDFWTPYSWCLERCPGWTVTRRDNLDGWLKPLVAFILPCVVFCLCIHRRRSVVLPDVIFKTDFYILGILVLPVKLLVASLVAAFDTIIWLGILFAMAGPIFLSLSYEAILDAKLLSYLDSQVRVGGLSIKERAHLLLALLLGNIEMRPAWDDSLEFLHQLPNDPPGACMLADPKPVAADHAQERRDLVVADVQMKLQAMLDSQSEFGATVGAPVLFYLGSFVWACFEIQANWGSS